MSDSQTDTIAAEIHAEALQHEIERFQDNLKVIKEKIKKKWGEGFDLMLLFSRHQNCMQPGRRRI